MHLFFHREVLLLRMNNLARLKGIASRTTRSTGEVKSNHRQRRPEKIR